MGQATRISQPSLDPRVAAVVQALCAGIGFVGVLTAAGCERSCVPADREAAVASGAPVEEGDGVSGDRRGSTPSPARSMRYTARSREQALAWQSALRARLARLLELDDLVAREAPIPFHPQPVFTRREESFTFQEVQINSTPARRITLALTIPTGRGALFPAVVCIAGHGHGRRHVYDSRSMYKGFAAALATREYVTVATDIAQHEVYEADRTLMGERLWDLMRSVDYLESRPEVDRERIGCAGLSLGGEMAMWLAAMDTRLKATVSSGFLTLMDQLEQDHCKCWKLSGLRELVDFPDIYALIAPRALLCQNGLQEKPGFFTVPLARKALKEIQVAYGDFGHPERVVLDVHEGGHEVHLQSLLSFLEEQLENGGRR